VRPATRLLALLLVCVFAVAMPACKRSQAAASQDPEAVSLVVRADSEGLLLTWIDDKGDFHVETRVADVPMMGRDAVRVVDPNRDDGTHADRVFVVDLRQARPDGTYPVRAMSRTDFEALAVARRQDAGPTLASAGPPSSAAAAQDPGGGAPSQGNQPAARAAVIIIYGAEWCGACHDAARYLRSKGIAFVEKDIEKDPAAAREMKQKLAQNGLRAGSIPVIDVRGKVFVGFNPHEVDDALGTAL
jgi:glutaredoxin